MSENLTDILSQLPDDWTVERRDAVLTLLEEYRASLHEYRAAEDRVARARRSLVRLFARCHKDDCWMEFCGPASRDKCLYRRLHQSVAAEIATGSRLAEADGQSCLGPDSPRGP